MTEIPLISIIVPVYNIEEYVNYCIESIINQTYDNIEIILVDDGSTDRSGFICDEYSQKDKRIRVIHKINGGLSDARNAGLDVASGEYIGFIDGDDYIAPQMYAHLYKVMQENDADMSVCNFSIIDGKNKRECATEDYKVTVIQGTDVYKLVTDFNTSDIVAWNKLYKKQIFEGLRYKIGKLHEDQWIIPYIADRCCRVAKSDAIMYYYVSRENAISKGKLSTRRMYDLLGALSNSCDFFRNKELYSEQKMELRHLCNQIISWYADADGLFKDKDNVRMQLWRYFKNVLNSNRNVITKKQIIYKAFALSPPLGIRLKKIREMI